MIAHATSLRGAYLALGSAALTLGIAFIATVAAIKWRSKKRKEKNKERRSEMKRIEQVA